MDRTEKYTVTGLVVAILLLVGGLWWTVMASHRDCVDGCVREHIQPTAGRCEWVCTHTSAPIYLPTPP